MIANNTNPLQVLCIYVCCFVLCCRESATERTLKLHLMQWTKQFIMKEYFDFDRSDITIHQFHPQIRPLLAVNGIFFANSNSLIRFIWPAFNILIALLATSFEMMFMYRGLLTKDYQLATESFCYLFILASVSIIYFCILLKRDSIVELINEMNKDFKYICCLGSRFKDKFLNGQLLIWKLCWTWFTFATFVLNVYILTTLFLLAYQSLFATLDEHMVRPLIFPIWLPEDDPYRTPNYEVFMFFEIVICFIVLIVFGVYVYILFHTLLHYYNQMDMIILAFQVLFENLDESVVELCRCDPRRMQVQQILNERMKQIVIWHNSIFDAVDSVASTFGPILVYQVMFSSIVLCLMAYQVIDIMSTAYSYFNMLRQYNKD